MPANISLVELIWTIIALVGVLVNLWAAGDAWADLIALQVTGLNGAREMVARGNIRREWFRVFKQGCFLVVGLFFMATPPVPGRGGQGPSTASIVLVAGLLLASFSMDLGALIDRRERIQTIDYINRHAPADGAQGAQEDC